jgi:hypothetical protein
VLLSWNVRLPVRRPAIPVVKVAFPALLELANTTLDVGAKKKLGELEELLTIPAPVNSRLLAKGTLNEYADAPGLKVNPPMVFAPKTVSPVIVDAANVAVPVGTARVDQLSGLLKVPVKGTVRHVAFWAAFWAWPELTPSTPAMTLAANNCPRMAPPTLVLAGQWDKWGVLAKANAMRTATLSPNLDIRSMLFLAV